MKIIISQRIVAVLALAAFSVIATACGNSSPTPTSTPSHRAEGYDFVQVGRGDMSDAVAARLFAQGAEVDRVEDVAGIEFTATTMVLFDGQWFEARRDDPAFLQFLGTTVDAGVLAVMIGGRTSMLYEALNNARAIGIPVGEDGQLRNPAHDNPPMAGIQLGSGLTAPHMAHLASNTTDSNTLADALLRWSAPEWATEQS